MKSVIFQEKMLHDFSQNPDFPAAYRGKDHLENHQKTVRRDAATPHVHSKLSQENVLDGTKREYYNTWFRKNVLGGTKSWSQ